MLVKCCGSGYDHLFYQAPLSEPIGRFFLAKGGCIFGFLIHEQYRRQGYGHAMMRELIEEARADGVEKLSLQVMRHNIPAVKIYERAGFRFSTLWSECECQLMELYLIDRV